jgi:hypothetical protein
MPSQFGTFKQAQRVQLFDAQQLDLGFSKELRYHYGIGHNFQVFLLVGLVSPETLLIPLREPS